MRAGFALPNMLSMPGPTTTKGQYYQTCTCVNLGTIKFTAPDNELVDASEAIDLGDLITMSESGDSANASEEQVN